MAQDRKHLIASALCKRLSLDPQDFSKESDVKSLCTNIFKSASLDCNDEVMKWIAFAESFPTDSQASAKAIKSLNDELVQKSVLLGNGFKVSEADVIVYSVIHSYVVALPKSDRQNISCVLRWIDYVQSKEDFGGMFEKVPVEKARFEPPASKPVAAAEANSNPKGPAKDTKADTNSKKDTAKGTKSSGAPETEKKSPEDTGAKKAKGDKGATEAGQKKAGTESVAKDDVPVTLLNIQVGVIRNAKKHPSADSLLIEEIDVGESKVRQVVSGLAKFCNPEDLVNRRVVLITNVKPGKLRDVVSEGLVLCASNEDHSAVEPLLPPEGAKVGERVCFEGHEGKPEDVLNPKKKQLDKITPHLFTDENGVATYKGIPFMTSGGPCTSSIRKGTVK